MAYELFKRTSARVDEPSISLVPDGRMALNAAAVRIFREAKVKAVLLLWDKSDGKIALKATARVDKNSYAVTIVEQSHSGSLRAKSFFTYIGWNASRRVMLPAIWDGKNKMFIITIPKEYMTSLSSRDSKQKA